MTAIEAAIARRAHVLEERAKQRRLTEGERDFLKKIAPLLRRLAEREQKSVARAGRESDLP